MPNRHSDADSPFATRHSQFPRHSLLMDIATAARLEKIESALAHLEHQHEQLNGVVTEQARIIARLQKEVARASEAMEGQELERIRANNQKPPHYQ